MTVERLLSDLTARGAQFERDGERVFIKAPPGVLTPAILDELRARRAEVLALLTDDVPPDLQRERALAAAWRGAVRELGELAGHPELRFAPGRCVGPGALNWGKFVGRASLPDLQLLLAAVQGSLAAIPEPGLRGRRSLIREAEDGVGHPAAE